MKSRILLASTALALVLQPVSLPLSTSVSLSVGNAYAQTAEETEEARKLREAAEQPAEEAESAPVEPKPEDQPAEEAQTEPVAPEPVEEPAEEAQTEPAEEPVKEAETAPAVPEPVEQPAQEAETAPADAPAAEENTAAETAEPTTEQTREQRRKERREAETTDDADPDTADSETEPDTETAAEPTGEPADEPATETTAETEGDTPPAPSADAPVANEVASEPIETQIQQAEETAPAVVPDEITAEQRKDLKAADNKRRKKAKDNRAELIGAAAVGVAIGALLPSIGGTVVEDQGDRFVVERDGRYYVRKDESALFRDNARDVEYERLRGGRVLETVYRRNGSRIETIRDAGGYVLRRVKITPNGREIILFDSRDIDDRRRINYTRTLPPIQLSIPREEYIVMGGNVGRRSLAEVFSAGPVEEITNEYSLRDIRENVRVRDIVRRVDLDTINFDSGSFTVRSSQVPYLADTAGAMLDEIEANSDAVFLIEGHTDAVGSDVSNLTLSDRRAETVARILVEAYDVPAENLVTEGYGEQFLKVETEGDERENRRVTIRNIAPLLNSKS